jgi:hypothetical protein
MAAFVALCGLVYAGWALTIPYNHAPDEADRFIIVDFIARHHALPSGLDPAARIPLWGTSYAFQPMLTAIAGAVLSGVTATLGGDRIAQATAARFVSVLCGMGTVAVCVTLGRHFFRGPWRMLFPVLVGLLPQFAFISSYINNDALAVLATALVVLAWVRGLEAGWTVRNAALLGGALALCSLSYVNTYGFLPLSVVLCAVERVMAWRTATDRGAFWRTTGVAVGVVSIVWSGLALWWFIRNGLLYDGDVLGLTTSGMMIERYGAPHVQPEVIAGAARRTSVMAMVLGRWWLILTVASFIGMFGYAAQQLPLPSYVTYLGVWLVAGVSCLAMVARWLYGLVTRRPTEPRAPTVLPGISGGRRVLLYGCFLVSMAIPWALSLYRSWTQDFQPQGRYVMPMLIPFTFFVVWGLESVVDRYVPRLRTVLIIGLTLGLVAILAQAWTVAIR